MFYPLEAVFTKQDICFHGNRDILGSYCYSLLDSFDVNKIEIPLHEHYFTLLAGLNAIKHNQEIEEALLKSCGAILAETEILKEIKPFGYIDTDEIRSAFSDDNIYLVKNLLSGKDFGIDTEFLPSSPISEYMPATALRLRAEEAAERISGLMKFYAALYDEIPEIYGKIHRIADRYSHIDNHDSDHLFTLAFLEFRLDAAVQPNVNYTPYIPSESADRFVPGKTMQFKTYTDLIVTELFESLMIGHYLRLCLVCKRPFMKTDQNIQKYCTGISLFYHKHEKTPMTCKQYAKQYGVPETADGDPFKVVCKKRTDCIRTEKNRGTITPAFAQAATLMAQNHYTRALTEPDYTLSQYKENLKKDNLYKETAEYLQDCRSTG